MKRFTTSVLVFFMLILSVNISLADISYVVQDEDFAIRSGIHFGITKDEIARIETNRNFSEPYDVTAFYGKDSCDLSYFSYVLGNGTLVLYWLDNNQSLDEFQYFLIDEAAYSEIKSSLIETYGNPLLDEPYHISGTAIDSLCENCEKLGIPLPKTLDYAGWIIQYNDCYVMLETKCFLMPHGREFYVVNYDIRSYEDMAS